jgi:hypothetical protein
VTRIQSIQIIKNIQKALLVVAVNASLKDVVRTHVYVPDIIIGKE